MSEVGYGEKRTAMFRIYQILLEETDETHPLTQKRIEELLKSRYGIVVERKAVARHLRDLEEMGETDLEVEFIHGDNGWFVSRREFGDTELRMLIDMMLSNRCFTETRTMELVEKLIRQGTPTFRSGAKYVHSPNKWNKTENKSVANNIDAIDTAIRDNRQIQFEYIKYGIDKKLHVSSKQTVSPYQLVFRNQGYYLVSFNEHWKNFAFYQLDHVKNIVLLDEARTPPKELPNYDLILSNSVISKERPYMYTDVPERVTCLIDVDIIDQVICQFGKDIHIFKTEDPKVVKVSMSTSLQAMKYWALQYIDHMEVLEPAALREEIRKSLERGRGKY